MWEADGPKVNLGVSYLFGAAVFLVFGVVILVSGFSFVFATICLVIGAAFAGLLLYRWFELRGLDET